MGGLGGAAMGLLLLSQANAGGAANQSCEGGAAREMEGHVFIPSELTILPFATTYYRNVIGVARSTGDGPRVLSTGEQVGTRTYHQAALSLRFELQVAPTSWLAVRAGGSFTGYTGTGGGSALVLGQVFQYRLLVGATVSRRLGDRMRVGITLDGGPNPVYTVNTLDAIENAIQNRAVDDAALVKKTTASVIIPGVAASYAVHQSTGVTLNVLWEHPFGTTSGANINADSITFAGHVDFDSRPFWRVPVGAIAGYRFAVPTDGSGVRQDVAVGAFYTGRRSLVLGFEGDWRQLPQRRLSSSSVLVGQIVLRYYW